MIEEYMSAKKRGLGRGLDALLATSQASSAAERYYPEQSELHHLGIEFLKPGKYQPRKDMSPDGLEELASSIRAQGIIQPIIVRQVAEHSYEIIAGERRWRASQLAGLDKVPCLVKEVPDEAAVAIALIENIQREDLNAMEEAQALERLMNEFELTHQEVATAVGKSRTTVTNLLRLNNLHEDVKILLEHGDIEMGHARALLALEGVQQHEAAQIVSGKGMTVRDTESLVRRLLEPVAPKTEKKPDPDVLRLQTELSENLGARVQIAHNAKGKGKLVINYSSLDELDGILLHIK
jgi:ParB family chromosome partitioning protein